jgi:predicted peroxiredoxin/TusA-related sulfurtransferase
MKTQEKTSVRILVDARWTWKPYRVIYEVIKAMRAEEIGSVVEVSTKDDKGLLNDVATWCEATGHEILSSERPSEGEVRSLIRKGEPRPNDQTMTVIMSTASLEHAVYPLDKALAGAVLGMDVNVVFEGAGVRLLKRGYRSKLNGTIGGLFTSMVERVMKKEIGWPLPQESIVILEDLGAHFYVCGPSMFGYGVREEDLIVREYALGAVVTWADLLAHSDIHVFSKAQFEKP